MQVGNPAPESLRALIRDAFPDQILAASRAEDLLLEPYRTNEEAWHMANAFRGRRWSELARGELTHNSDSLFALSGDAFRAYVPAYLMAAISDDRAWAGEMAGYVLDRMEQRSDRSPTLQVAAREHRGALDNAQRAVIGEVLRYLETSYGMRRASEILQTWT